MKRPVEERTSSEQGLSLVCSSPGQERYSSHGRSRIRKMPQHVELTSPPSSATSNTLWTTCMCLLFLWPPLRVPEVSFTFLGIEREKGVVEINRLVLRAYVSHDGSAFILLMGTQVTRAQQDFPPTKLRSSFYLLFAPGGFFSLCGQPIASTCDSSKYIFYRMSPRCLAPDFRGLCCAWHTICVHV